MQSLLSRRTNALLKAWHQLKDALFRKLCSSANASFMLLRAESFDQVFPRFSWFLKKGCGWNRLKPSLGLAETRLICVYDLKETISLYFSESRLAQIFFNDIYEVLQKLFLNEHFFIKRKPFTVFPFKSATEEATGHGRRKGKEGGLGFRNFQKKVVFLVSRGKNEISPLLAPPRKFLEKSTRGPPLEKILPTPMLLDNEEQTNFDAICSSLLSKNCVSQFFFTFHTFVFHRYMQFKKVVLYRKNEKLKACCMLSRNHPVGFCFLHFAVIQACTYLYSSNYSPQRWQVWIRKQNVL